VKVEDSKIEDRTMENKHRLGIRQQLYAIRNAILEYGEVKANKELKQKINGLFRRHLS
jgi:hypothetical protein